MIWKKIVIQFNNTALVLENQSTKIIHVYTINDLGYRTKNPHNNFVLTNCLFGATNIVKNSDVYSGYEIAFDGTGSSSFGNDYARNVIMFGVDNNSSHTDNRKNTFLSRK